MSNMTKHDSASDQAIRTALQTSLYPGASNDSVSMVLAYCQASGLDPLTKPVHIVPMWVKGANGQGSMRDVVMPGIELYRTKAHRTGEYAGQDEVEFGPVVNATLGGVTVRYPEWAKVTVYRITPAGRVPFSAKVYWLESYATAKRDTDEPNAMWRKRPWGQLEKCAEALALRKAFPEAVGGQATAEEMEGKVIDGSAVEVGQPAQATHAATRASQLPPPAAPTEEEEAKAAEFAQAIADAETPEALQELVAGIAKLPAVLKDRLRASYAERLAAIKPAEAA
jgi:phage recombination protein Bet